MKWITLAAYTKNIIKQINAHIVVCMVIATRCVVIYAPSLFIYIYYMYSYVFFQLWAFYPAAILLYRILFITHTRRSRGFQVTLIIHVLLGRGTGADWSTISLNEIREWELKQDETRGKEKEKCSWIAQRIVCTCYLPYPSLIL